MPLNIHLISHPIIKKISNEIIYSINANDQAQCAYYEIYNLLIYETIRKWIKTYTIYIKNIDLINEIYEFDNQDSYLLITNFMDCGNMINTIYRTLPQVYLQHINLKKYKTSKITDDCLEDKIINIIKRQKIIIIENFLKNYSIIQLLDYLSINKQIKLANIKIICITCNNSILEYMGHKYPSLQIYTTQINYY